MILSTNKGVKSTSELFSHGTNKAFLAPDSSRAMRRNGNSILIFSHLFYIITLYKITNKKMIIRPRLPSKFFRRV